MWVEKNALLGAHYLIPQELDVDRGSRLRLNVERKAVLGIVGPIRNLFTSLLPLVCFFP